MTEEPINRERSVLIEAPAAPLPVAIMDKLRSELARCPDVAFAHLPQVVVPEQSSSPQLTLFVWLVPEAVGSLRPALNLVSEAVANALPEDRFLDVVILNSAPELLLTVEAAHSLLVERDGEERRRACAAAAEAPAAELAQRPRWYWPF
jgi:hypothetical protein